MPDTPHTDQMDPARLSDGSQGESMKQRQNSEKARQLGIHPDQNKGECEMCNISQCNTELLMQAWIDSVEYGESEKSIQKSPDPGKVQQRDSEFLPA